MVVESDKLQYQPPAILTVQNIDLTHIEFHLPLEFLSKYQGKQPDWGPLGYVTFKRTYARMIYDEHRTEEWYETVKRVVEGEFRIQKKHCLQNRLPWSEEKAIESAEITFDLMWNFKFTPPGRGIWMMGTEFVETRGSAALNNCGFISTKNIATEGAMPFAWCMDMLMQGVGVGFDTKGAKTLKIKPVTFVSSIFTIPDTREGWWQSMMIVVDAFFLGERGIPVFDYSKIRPKGAPIRGFGGVASGPDPLKELLISLQQLLSKRIGLYITSVDIVDIMNYIAKCVVAGNVRRSAQIALGQADDEDYVTCKQDDQALYDHRWASNNSVYAYSGMDYESIVPSIVKNGEPGIFWIENARAYSRMGFPADWKDKKIDGANPCMEQTLESYELCCLCETFPSRHESYEDFERTLKYAYMYAKTVTLLNTHWAQTNNVMLKNHRIGISQSGIIDAFNKFGRREILRWCERGYEYLQKKDKQYSEEWLCVPLSKKIATVKPSGTISLLAGVSPGIHYPHAEYYIRRIRFALNDPLADELKKCGYRVYGDPWGANKNSDGTTSYKMQVVEFPIHERHFGRSKFQVSMWEQLANAIDYQHYWSDNQVSITITFNKSEEKDIAYALQYAEDKLKGVSFLPSKDHSYQAPPYEEITAEQYQCMMSEIKQQPDFSKIKYFQNLEAAAGEQGCTNEACVLKEETKHAKTKEEVKNELESLDRIEKAHTSAIKAIENKKQSIMKEVASGVTNCDGACDQEAPPTEIKKEESKKEEPTKFETIGIAFDLSKLKKDEKEK